uniref:CFAP20 domain containing n=1 Tax=Catharus ustulatus TaxID=91951 RepID=A0A8C3Y8H1_CATUS
KWKIFGNLSAISKEYDKELKGFVFVLEGNSLINKMKLPREAKQTLGLVQRYLTLQIFVPLGKDFSTELLITDFENNKRRLYLSTVHKELIVTPLHAKIPLFMIKRKIWCNMCIDLVTFTCEIFRGAFFKSLDGIIVSANCKLRKIFTLKYKPRDTTEEDGVSYDIPTACQINCDVLQVTQVLKPNAIHKPKIKCRENAVQETGILLGQGNICNGKTQDVSHIAFGTKILGPPPSSNRRTNAKVPGKTQKTSVSREADFQLTSPQVPSTDKNSPRRLSLNNAAKPTWEITSGMVLILCYFTFQFYVSSSQFTYLALKLYFSDKWVLPERFTETIQLDRKEHSGATGSSACSAQNASKHDSSETADHHKNKKEVFTFSSKPRSAPYGNSPNLSPDSYVCPLELELDSNGEHEKTETEDSFEGTESSEEEYGRKKYQSSRLSSSELPMLASMKRQQNEELRDAGISHELSTSQINCCNVSSGISSNDDTATWNSCFPPVSLNSQDWLNTLNPPIIPGNQQLKENTKSSTEQRTQGEDHLSAEEDEEVLALLYDPCLNCYFDPNSGKYYKLAWSEHLRILFCIHSIF